MTTKEKTEEKLSIYRKIFNCMKGIGTIEKNGYNSFHRYAYATEADVISAVSEVLGKNGLVVLPSIHDIAPMPLGDGILVHIKTKYKIVDVDTGESIELDWAGSGTDKGDKALYKALTGGHKYFFMRLLQIATGEDPERDNEHEASSYKPQNKPQQAAQAKSGEYRYKLTYEQSQGPYKSILKTAHAWYDKPAGFWVSRTHIEGLEKYLVKAAKEQSEIPFEDDIPFNDNEYGI